MNAAMNNTGQQDDEVQYVEAEPIEPGASPVSSGPVPTGEMRGFYYRGPTGGVPCCSGCGCLFAALGILILLNPGSIVSTVVAALAAAWISGVFLRMLGINRSSAAYVMIMIPVFLAVTNLVARFLRGTYPYTWREVVLGTLSLYLVLVVAGVLTRKNSVR